MKALMHKGLLNDRTLKARTRIRARASRHLSLPHEKQHTNFACAPCTVLRQSPAMERMMHPAAEPLAWHRSLMICDSEKWCAMRAHVLP